MISDGNNLLPNKKDRLIVGITGASGALYGIRLLELLREMDLFETHLILSQAAEITIAHETNYKIKDVLALADVFYKPTDITASIASGSFITKGMIIAPCSMNTLGEIAASITGSLISRAADVVLKERRHLVLMTRESPLHLNHLRNMVRATEAGAIIAPPMPSFYTKPSNMIEAIDYQLIRVLDLFGIHITESKRWQ